MKTNILAFITSLIVIIFPFLLGIIDNEALEILLMLIVLGEFWLLVPIFWNFYSEE